MPNLVRRWFLLVCFVLVPSSSTIAGDWYRWRGPALNGVSEETEWTDQWPQTGPAIAWLASVGTGLSSVSVSDGRLFTIGNADNTDTVICLDAATGKPVWKYSYQCPLDDKFFEGGPTSTPTVDGRFVYTLSRQGELFCFEAATGAVRWSKNVAQEIGVRVSGWGFAGSPLVHEDVLVLNVGEAGTAVDKTSGTIVWKSADREAGYATPVPMRQGSQTLAVIASSRFVLAVDIRTGKELWRHRWLTRFGCNAADPIVSGAHVFISSGYGRGAALLRLTDGEPSSVWAGDQMQNQISNSVLIDGDIYGLDGNTEAKTSLKCLELATGTVKWAQDWTGMAALTAANGKLIILSEQGELIIAKASPDAFQIAARAQVLTGKCWTVPVLSHGRIYCRSADGQLVCVDVRKSS